MYEIIPTENICPVKLILLGISNTVLNNNAVPSKACVTLSLCIFHSSVLIMYVPWLQLYFITNFSECQCDFHYYL